MSEATDAGDEEIEESSAPLMEHLAELRTRLIRSVIAFVIGIVVAFAVAEPILQILLKPIEATLRGLGDPAPVLQFTAPQEYLFTLFRISMVFGFALAFPVIAHQLWRFVAPGLYRTEKAAFLPFIIASPVMFLIGASFALFAVIPLAMQFLLGFADFSFSGALSSLAGTVGIEVEGGGALPATADGGLAITFIGKVNESLDLTLKFIMAFGLCFQLPVLLTLMGKAGLVSARGLATMRKYAMIGILVLAALVTPPDVITQLILFVVVYGLYEVSIQLVKMVEKKRVQKLREEGILGEDEDLYSEFDDDEEDIDVEGDGAEDPKS